MENNSITMQAVQPIGIYDIKLRNAKTGEIEKHIVQKNAIGNSANWLNFVSQVGINAMSGVCEVPFGANNSQDVGMESMSQGYYIQKVLGGVSSIGSNGTGSEFQGFVATDNTTVSCTSDTGFISGNLTAYAPFAIENDPSSYAGFLTPLRTFSTPSCVQFAYTWTADKGNGLWGTLAMRNIGALTAVNQVSLLSNGNCNAKGLNGNNVRSTAGEQPNGDPGKATPLAIKWGSSTNYGMKGYFIENGSVSYSVDGNPTNTGVNLCILNLQDTRQNVSGTPENPSSGNTLAKNEIEGYCLRKQINATKIVTAVSNNGSNIKASGLFNNNFYALVRLSTGFVLERFNVLDDTPTATQGPLRTTLTGIATTLEGNGTSIIQIDSNTIGIIDTTSRYLHTYNMTTLEYISSVDHGTNSNLVTDGASNRPIISCGFTESEPNYVNIAYAIVATDKCARRRTLTSVTCYKVKRVALADFIAYGGNGAPAGQQINGLDTCPENDNTYEWKTDGGVSGFTRTPKGTYANGAVSTSSVYNRFYYVEYVPCTSACGSIVKLDTPFTKTSSQVLEINYSIYFDGKLI